jgi:hypothetical protein
MTDVYRQSWEKVPEGPKPDRRPEYTPTVEGVREFYSDEWDSYFDQSNTREYVQGRIVEFDRMIAEVERAAAVKALRRSALILRHGVYDPANVNGVGIAATNIEALADSIEGGGSA